MIITLDEMKNYLRVDHEDDDILLESLIASSQQLCMRLHISTNTGKMRIIWN